MDLKDTIEFLIAQSAAKANPANFAHQPPFFPRTHFLLTGPAGVPTVERLPAPARHDTLADFTSVVTWLGSLDDSPTSDAVWYNRSGVVVTHGFLGRTNSAKLPLPLTKPMAWLAGIDAKGVRLTQVELVRLLKTTLATSLTPGDDLLDRVRQVSIRRQQEGESVIAQGRVSMDKRLVRQMSGVSELPLSVKFAVKVHESPELTTTAVVECAFDLDPGSSPDDPGHFLLDPLPGQVEAAFQKAEAEIEGRLADLFKSFLTTADLPPLVRGTPAV